MHVLSLDSIDEIRSDRSQRRIQRDRMLRGWPFWMPFSRYLLAGFNRRPWRLILEESPLLAHPSLRIQFLRHYAHNPHLPMRMSLSKACHTAMLGQRTTKPNCGPLTHRHPPNCDLTRHGMQSTYCPREHWISTEFLALSGQSFGFVGSPSLAWPAFGQRRHPGQEGRLSLRHRFRQQ